MCAEEEHIRALDDLGGEEPDIDDGNDGPAAIVSAFSDDESDDNNDPFLDNW